MIRVRYRNQVAIIDNCSGFGYELKTVKIFIVDRSMVFEFETEELAKSVFEKIFMTDKDLDIDAMLREDKETKKGKK